MSDFLMVPPPLDGLHEAMATARRRRYRKASMTTGIGASLALVVPLLLGSSGQAVLIPEPDVNQPAVTTSDAPTDIALPNHVTGVPNTAVGSGPGSLTTGPTASVALTASAAPLPQQPATSDRTVSPARQRRPYAAGPMKSSGILYTAPTCAVQGSGPQTGLCSENYATEDTDNRGQGIGTYTLTATLCNVDASDAHLVYDTSNEADFVISGKGEVQWRWSQWHQVAGGHHSTVLPPGACMEWTFDWTGVDAAGNKVAKGDYTVTTAFLAEGLGSRTVSSTFTIS